MERSRGERLLIYGAIFMSLLLVLQLVPYGHDRSNPPVVAEPSWDSQATRDLAKRACFDCHSNETSWPWYATVAPLAWLVHHDVEEGRRALNFTDWQGGVRKGENVAKIREEVGEGEMPPFLYRLAHPRARLSDEEKKRLIEGLTATINWQPSRGAGGPPRR